MKPYIHATIIFAGFFVAAGTVAIISAEYNVVSSRGEAVFSMLDSLRPAQIDHSLPVVADRIELNRDSDLMGTDEDQVKLDFAPTSVSAPEVHLKATPALRREHAARKGHAKRTQSPHL